MLEIADSIRESLERVFAGHTYGGESIQFYLVGSPPVIPRFPAITVELMGNENVPLALVFFAQEHTVRITVWTNASTYSESYHARAQIATEIETSLFRNVYPIIKPYCWSYLGEPLPREQTYAVVNDPSVFSPYPYETDTLPVYLDNGEHRYPNQFVQQMDDRTFELERPAPIDLDSQAIVIRPLVHAYDCLCESVDYGTGNQNELLLLHATLTYRLTIARLRYSEPYQTAQ